MKLKWRRLFGFSQKEIEEKELMFVNKHTFSNAPVHQRNKNKKARRKMAKISKRKNRS